MEDGYEYEEFLIAAIFAGTISVFNLPQSLYAFQFASLIPFVYSGFGQAKDFEKNSIRYLRAESFRRNMESFSGAKTFQQTLDLSSAVFKDGIKRPFKEFKEIALGINREYNLVWLKTEQDMAFKVAQSAERWMKIEDQKEIFPLLQYKTAHDERVRDSHAQWHNVIKPVSDPFWATWYPPNDWGCRCHVIQLREGKPTQIIGSTKNDSKVFANNAGISGAIYPKTGHPYFNVPRGFEKQLKLNFNFETPKI